MLQSIYVGKEPVWKKKANMEICSCISEISLDRRFRKLANIKQTKNLRSPDLMLKTHVEVIKIPVSLVL